MTNRGSRSEWFKDIAIATLKSFDPDPDILARLSEGIITMPLSKFKLIISSRKGATNVSLLIKIGSKTTILQVNQLGLERCVWLLGRWGCPFIMDAVYTIYNCEKTRQVKVVIKTFASTEVTTKHGKKGRSFLYWKEKETTE